MGAKGARLIVAEDEALLAMELCDILHDMGCLVVGTAARLQAALQLADTASFDLALLDMNLAGERIDPVAIRIQERGIPLVFITGYGARTLPAGIVAPVLDKPVSVDALATLIAGILGRCDD